MKGELSKRIVNSTILLVFFFYSLLYESVLANIFFSLFFLLIIVFILLEYFNITENISIPSFKYTSIFLVVLIFFKSLLVKRFEIDSLNYLLTSFIVLIAIFMVISFLREKQIKESLIKLINSIAGIILVMECVVPLVTIEKQTILVLVLLIKITDIGGYVVGKSTNYLMANGNHKIFPKISPNKSFEGLIGSILFCYALAYYFLHINLISYKIFLYSGIFFSFCALLGDLFESQIKRIGNVKDSGRLPGLGGALDLIDSLIIVVPIYVYFLN